jgi:uncharacterized protein YfeS
MSTIKTGYWVRVIDNSVTDCWDSAPPAGQDGWNEAVEIIPDLIQNREIMTTHTFDLSKSPVEIIWGKRDLEIDERKGSLIGQANGLFQQVVYQQIQLQLSANPAEEFDTSLVSAAKETLLAKIAQIEAATTHEEVDALM